MFKRFFQQKSKPSTLSTQSSSLSKSKTQASAQSSTEPQRTIYHFNSSGADGSASDKMTLGNKGANLAEICNIKMPVPPGFTIASNVCKQVCQVKGLGDALITEIKAALKTLESNSGRCFAVNDAPLFLSVRSGAAVSLPGLMCSVLNVGLNDESVKGLSAFLGDGKDAYNAYQRFIRLYAIHVMGLPDESIEEVFFRHIPGGDPNEVSLETIQALCESLKETIKKVGGTPFPQDPIEQLLRSIEAAFLSWDSPRTQSYVNAESLDLPGTAVIVQKEVFGIAGQNSGTGVAFSRNPANGENEFYGEFLDRAQGDDVVAGIREPMPVDSLSNWETPDQPDLGKKIHKQMIEIKDQLEAHYRDLMDMEFTIEKGEVYLLQTRKGKRTAEAAVRIASEMVQEGLKSKKEAVKSLESATDLKQLLASKFVPGATDHANQISIGLPASPGAASGVIAFTNEDAFNRAVMGESVILAKVELSVDDIEIIPYLSGLLLTTGGMISEAAIYARSMNRPCVSGASSCHVDEHEKTLSVNGQVYYDGDSISIDGATGLIYEGDIPLAELEITGHFKTLSEWADTYRNLQIYANADTPSDVRQAIKMGADGIGLSRTEHHFFEGPRIDHMREIILAGNEQERDSAIQKLLPLQTMDYYELLMAAGELPISFRLLDAPLFEFLSEDMQVLESLADKFDRDLNEVVARVNELHSHNPAMSNRGARRLICMPDIFKMQVTAITQAAIECWQQKSPAHPVIMIPMIATEAETRKLCDLLKEVTSGILSQHKMADRTIPISVMIETPRAVMAAEKIAPHCHDFCLASLDLTQFIFGLDHAESRNLYDAYYSQHVLDNNPFDTLDETVAEFYLLSKKRGDAGNPSLKHGLCNREADTQTINFLSQHAFDYLSCSALEVPIARFAAAHAVLNQE